MGFLRDTLGRSTSTSNSKQAGDAAEAQALRFLQQQGLRLLARNYRTPGRGGGEIDLVLQERDGTVVFVEVRSRSGMAQGGAGASIGSAKRARIVLAARHYLLTQNSTPPCRFDVVLFDNGALQWLRAAFDAS